MGGKGLDVNKPWEDFISECELLNFSFSVFPLLLLTVPHSVCSQVFSAGFQGKHGGVSNMYSPPPEYPTPACRGVSVRPPRACGGLGCGIVADVHIKMTDSLRQQPSSKSVSDVLLWLAFPGLRMGAWSPCWLLVLLRFIPPESLKSIINEQDFGFVKKPTSFPVTLLSLRWKKK